MNRYSATALEMFLGDLLSASQMQVSRSRIINSMTNPLFLLALAIAPTAVLLKYVLIKDNYGHESLRLVAKTFLLGSISTLGAAVLEFVFNIFIPFVWSFAYVAPIEEGPKFFVV